MKTIVFTLKPGFENKTIFGYKRVELIPGYVVPMTYGTSTPTPVDGTATFCFYDGKLGTLDNGFMDEACEDQDVDYPYLITYEESKWL